MTFSGPSAAYYFRRYLRRCFSPYTAYIDLATAYTNLAVTAHINLAVTRHGPPYYRPVRY